MKTFITNPEHDPEDFERHKREIEIMLAEYEQAILSAAAWINSKKEIAPNGFRAKRRAAA